MTTKNVEVRLSARIDQYKRGMADARQSTDQFSQSSQQSVNKVGTSFGAVGAKLKTWALPLATAAVTTFAVKTINAASDLEESINAVRVTFGDAADDVLALGESSAESFGLSTAAFNESSVAFASFATTIAGPGGDVAGTIEELMLRATDFASVMNLDVNEAMALFRSTLAGESEPIRRYGKDISAAAVEQYALANGLVASKSEMTESIKVQARYGLLMEKTSDVAGDFANTSEGLANQQRILAAQVENLSAEIGEHLTPALADAVGELTAFLQLAADLGLIDAAFKLREMGNAVGHLERGINVATGETDLFGRSIRHATDEQIEFLKAAKDAGYGTDDAVAAMNRGVTSLDQYIVGLRYQGQAAAESTVEVEASTEATEENTAASEAWARQAADVIDRYGEQKDAIAEWAEGIQSATQSGAESFNDFSIDADTSAQDFIDALNTSSAEIAAWQDDLLWIAATTSPEFAAHLAEMGASAAPMVDDIVSSGDNLEGAFNAWKMNSDITGRDMVSAFDQVSPGVSEKISAASIAANREIQSMGAALYPTAVSVGSSIGDGVGAGLRSRASSLASIAVSVASDALGAMKSSLGIKSPSRVFAEQVGEPIVDGVAAGIMRNADRISDSLVDAIDRAREDAMDAADDLVDAARDRFDGLFDRVDDKRRKTDLVERVSDDERRLAEADAKVAEALREHGRGSDEYAEAVERRSDAVRSLRDSNLDLLKSSTGLLDGNDKEIARFRELGRAAGLSKKEIDALVETHERLRATEAKAAQTKQGAKSNAQYHKSVVDEFAAYRQFLTEGDIKMLEGAGSTSLKLAAMKGIMARIDAFFASVSGRAAGGPVRAGRMYEVGEGNVAEMFMSAGRQYMIPGNDGAVIPQGKLTPASQPMMWPSGTVTTAPSGPLVQTGDIYTQSPRGVRQELEQMAWKAGAR